MKSKLGKLEEQVTDLVKRRAKQQEIFVHVAFPRAEGKAIQAYAKRHKVSMNELVRRTVKMLVDADVMPL